MPTANIVPTYYRVTWNGASPTDYNALLLDQSGGLDNTLPEKYNRLIKLAGTDGAVSVTQNHSIRINDVEVVFTANPSNLSDVITAINALTTEHKVIAFAYDTNYLGLQNAWGREGEPIWIAAGVGTALTDLGLTAGVSDTWPSVFGSASPTRPAAGEDIKFNGVTVTFGAGDVGTIAAVCAKINTQTPQHEIVAAPAGAGIQLTSVTGKPFTLANGVSGVVADLGFSAGNQGGTPLTYTQSLSKERATMRWDAVVFELGWLISPVFLGEITKTGNIIGTEPVTTLSWTVAYDRPSYLSTEDELTPGVQLTGANCIKRLIARALTQTYVGNQEIYDPTLTTTGNTCVRVNPSQIIQVTAAALDAVADIVTVEANITVTQIANV